MFFIVKTSGSKPAFVSSAYRLSAVLIISLMSPILLGTASADDYHYASNLIGDRAAGMAGAYGAISDDTSGLYYNPAGIRFASGNSVSASGNSWKHEAKTYQGALGSYNYERDSTTIQPNFFGVVQQTIYGTVGFSYVIPDSVLQQQDQTYGNPNNAVNQFTLNYNNEVNTYNIGPSFATDLNKELKIGLSLYYFYKKRKTINNELTTLTAAGSSVQYTNSLFKDEEYGTRPVVGLLYAPENGKYSVGLAMSKIFVFNANQYYQSASLSQAPAFQYGGVLPDYPWETRLGFAYFPSNALLISADLDYFSQANSDSFVYSWTRQPVLNVAVGAEYYLSPTVAVRTGLFTNFSNVNNQGLVAGADDKVDIYGLALSAAWFTKYSSISFGLNYAWGSGQASISQTAAGQPILGTMSENILTVFLGTSYNY